MLYCFVIIGSRKSVRGNRKTSMAFDTSDLASKIERMRVIADSLQNGRDRDAANAYILELSSRLKSERDEHRHSRDHVA